MEIGGKTEQKGTLNCLTFKTYRGKECTLGVDAGIPFSHTFEGHTFGSFSGGHRDYVDSLQIKVLPVPQEFLNQFKPILINLHMNNKPVLST